MNDDFSQRRTVSKFWYIWSIAKTTDFSFRVLSRPPMSKKRPTETGIDRGGPHHALRLHLDLCMLCRQVGHRASECPNRGKSIAFSFGKRAFGTYALGCAVFETCVMVLRSETSKGSKMQM